jgi:hypothetical protein
MKIPRMLPYILSLGFVLSVAGILLAQSTPDRALFVNGKPAGTVTQVGGHSYIDIDTVAQITNGTLTVEFQRGGAATIAGKFAFKGFCPGSHR